MTVKGTSGKGYGKQRSAAAAKSSATPVSEGPQAPGGVSGKAGAGKSGGGSRRTFGIAGCIVLLVVLCCIASLVFAYYTGDSILEFWRNIQLQ